MNWNKAKKSKEYEDVEGKNPKHVYSNEYFNKLKAKAIEIAKSKPFYDFRRYDATQSINGKPKARYSSMATGASNGVKDWEFDTGRLDVKTDSVDVAASTKVTTVNNTFIGRYKGNVACFVKKRIS